MLVEEYWASLVTYANRILGGLGAEDVVQETFMHLWEHRTQWEASGSLRALLYRITRNLSLNEKRWRRVRERRTVGGAGLHRTVTPSPMEVLEENELRLEVERAIGALPTRRREVFVLAWFHQLSYEEIAEILGIARQTVANQMAAALSELRRSLGRLRQDPL